MNQSVFMRILAIIGILVTVRFTLATESTASAQGFSPEEAVRRMTPAAGFEVQLLASEPLVRQPVCIEFDDRGRLWVIQYLQYPNPAGLKRVQVDRFSRTKYDRVPEPPPHGPRGADRITILEDRDGDGHMDHSRDFIDGLNLATGIAFGHGGVFVINVPYLLFYPDMNRDDVPDGDPEVLLTGFGMEDAHSVANSLMWGPDGWLYGCQGSTVTANIRGIEFQQGVWRYHPLTRAFELFCEGGGNAWGLDFDRVGQLLYSTNHGGYAMLHGVQGASYWKSFGKHGALHNPHAYGYFDHVPYKDFRGGHITAGGIVYQGDSFPDSFRGKYIAADLLKHCVTWHNIVPRGSTFQSSYGGELLIANDTWFAPCDVTMGPDGAIYVADWHDSRTAHPDPDADWDRSNGRIYRIAAKGTPPARPIDFAKLSTTELLDLHQHRSQWYVRRARQELVRRHENSVHQTLKDKLAADHDEVAALEVLWSLNVVGGFDESLGMRLLGSPHPAVRSWTVRLLVDSGPISAEMAHRLDKFAEKEPVVTVRQQLASTAALLAASQALPIINANINRDIDNDDPYLPLLWWWAVERHSVSGREEVLRRFVRPSLWKSKLGRDTLLIRLIRRYAAEGSSAGMDSVLKLVQAAPDDAARHALWSQILQGWREIPHAQQPEDRIGHASGQELSNLVLARWRAEPDDATLLQLSLALGNRESFETAFRDSMNPQIDVSRRVVLFGILADVAESSLIEPLLKLIASDEPEMVRIAALQTLGRLNDPRIASTLIELHRRSTSEKLNSRIRDELLGRKEGARAWLTAVDRGDIAASATPLEQVRQVALFDDAQLDSVVAKHWGKLQAASREEKLAEVRRLSNDVRAAPGNVAAGKLVYKKHCASCHQLFGEGTKLGPDLTTANRLDRQYMLISLVDPSSVIRKEFVSFVVTTKDGRVLTGLVGVRDEASMTLVNPKNEKTTITRGDIDEIRESPVSLMPDDLYRQLKPQDLRDLFAYMESPL